MTSRQGLALRIVGSTVVVAVVALAVVVALSTVIWPGQATVTRHVLCDEVRPDAFVVSEAYEVSGTAPTDDGTSIRFTMVCVGPHGEAEDVGWLRPVALLAALYAVVIGPAALLARALVRPRRDARGDGAPRIGNRPGAHQVD